MLDGLELFNNNQKPQAVKKWEQALENGALNRAYFLGQCYHFGEGVTQNLKKIFDYYMQSANNTEHNNATVNSQYNIGKLMNQTTQTILLRSF